jgi:hypothetical protein
MAELPHHRLTGLRNPDGLDGPAGPAGGTDGPTPHHTSGKTNA